ncbi:protein phosphatase 1 regulatory subunit 37 [Chanos chanos]|uniref:Protein phosphatase 1 regulatory subunit 37 n=1 Tax=Chanos chanos TaxID=29144 RepID=A0A6J2WHD7_CHACN|nr:protein phosphatase 1 regulatory subunit 37-like [Chanos chanos]
MTRHSEGQTSSQFGKKCKSEKHVSFPPDEQIVSGTSECEKKHHDAERYTLSEIILAYKQSCEKHQVEPNSKILAQLMEITNLSNRARCLDLKGERLDYRSCESLEEILKSVQFDFINLQEADLEENGATSLLDMILYYESATHLNVSSNTTMGISGWQALSHMIKQSLCLWRLDACNMPIVEYPVQALSKALLTSRLTVLHLENSCLSGKPLFTLVGALRKNRTLQELCLANNDLNSYQDAMQLGELLKYNSSLRVLDLSNNLISDTGLEEICHGLRGQKAGLRTLVLWNNQITHRGMIHLEDVLPHLKILETLNLGGNDVKNTGIHALKESLMINRSISHLGLVSTGITCEGTVTLAEILAENPKIQRLDLRQNRILTGGLMALSLALKINCSVTKLDLDQILKEEKERASAPVSDEDISVTGTLREDQLVWWAPLIKRGAVMSKRTGRRQLLASIPRPGRTGSQEGASLHGSGHPALE